MNNKSVLVIGDITVDVFLTPKPGDVSCRMCEKEQYLCFSYGDKIPVENLYFSAGGNAANVSIGLRRLDIEASIVTTIGTDSVSKLIYEHLEQEHIDTQHLTMQPGISTNYATIISFQGERTILTYHAPRTYRYRKDPFDAAYVYLTSMGESYKPYYQELITHLRENPGVTLIYNPGSIQMRSGKEENQFILSRTNILLCNKKEAEIFTGIPASDQNEKALLAALRSMGPKEVVITDGVRGAFACNNIECMRSSALPVKVIEKTGAGDAFNAGYIAAKLHGKSFQESMKWGTMNAASVIGYIGAQKGLLHTNDITSWERIAEQAHGATQAF